MSLSDRRLCGRLPENLAALTAAQPWTQGGQAQAASALLFIQAETNSAPCPVVFTRRTTRVRTHKGQVSFPGGRRDEGDADPVSTALRELEEELGVASAVPEIHGVLRPRNSLDRSRVETVVMSAPLTMDDLVPSPDEVDAVFSIPWDRLRRQAARQFSFNIFGSWRTSWQFDAKGENIWGLTAAILYDADLS